MGINKHQHDLLYPSIVARDLTQDCIRCGKKPEQGKTNEIHHINGDDTDNRLENLCLLCHGCNHLRKLRKANLPVSTISYQLSASQKVNLIKEPHFRRWLEGKILANNYHYPLDLVIRQGSLECGLNPVTIKRYISYLSDHPSAPYVTQAGRYSGMELYLKGHEPTDIDYS